LIGCRIKNYEDGNASVIWENLKSKLDQVSAPTLVATEIMFRHSMLGKNKDPKGI
jgi:hypothetical protein